MTRETPDGLMLVDKPAGVTSHDVVALARRALRTRRVGHAGTLDPFATGLLVLLVGRATRLLPYVEGEPKVYEAVVAFGIETATDDLTGEVTRQAELPRAADVDAGIASLTGRMHQMPPAFSAKQVGGIRAHAAARAGTPLELSDVVVTVHRWEILERTDASLRARITCTGGTYVRALARDLGRAAGSAAHLAELRRLASGPFSVADASSAAAVSAGEARVRPALDAIPSMAAFRLDDAQLTAVRHGRSVAAAAAADRVALVAPDGSLAGIGEREGDWLRPRVVFDAA